MIFGEKFISAKVESAEFVFGENNFGRKLTNFSGIAVIFIKKKFYHRAWLADPVIVFGFGSKLVKMKKSSY